MHQVGWFTLVHDVFKLSRMSLLRRLVDSLVVRLIALGFVLLLIGTLGRMVVISRYLGPDMLDQSGKQLLAASEMVAGQIESGIHLRRDTLQVFAGQLVGNTQPLGPSSAALSVRLAGFHALTPLFSDGLVLLDAAGQVKAASGSDVASRHAGLLTHSLVQQALSAGFAIGQPGAADTGVRAVLPMAVALKQVDATVTDVLVGLVALDAKGFVSVLHDSRLSPTGALVLVLPQDRVVLAATQGHMALSRMTDAGQQADYGSAMKGRAGVTADVNSSGVQSLTATAAIPSTGWFVVASQPASDVLQPLENMQRRMIGNAVWMLVVMVLLLVVGLRHVFKPLVSSAELADKMTRDEVPLMHLPVIRNDEVGHLTSAFNRLLDKLSEAQIELSEMAHHDTLTGLPNRSLLADVLMRALTRARRNGTEVAVLFLDLDGFKPINDAYGHACGDEALQQVAQRLTSVMRQADTVARIGGDEFVVLLSDLSAGDREGVEQVAQKCLNAFDQPFHVKGNAIQLGVSVGIAMAPGATPADTLMSAADTAMYSAKQAGKGRIVWATAPDVPPVSAGPVPTG